MFVLSSVALTWSIVQNQIYQHQLKRDAQSHGAPAPNSPAPPKPESPQDQQMKMARKLMALAPSNGIEIAAWGLLCLIVGFSEEFIFRGYLQSQGILVLRSAFVGVLFSALVFGAAHGYQGLRGMVLIGVYGALFSGITLLRRNLLPGMIAHSWHDFATGMLLAYIRETHLLEKLPHSV
jgi:CAAX protease family protein